MFLLNRSRSACLVIAMLVRVPFTPSLAVDGFSQVQRTRGMGVIVVAAEVEANAIRERLRAGESFDTLARVFSIDPSAADGGSLGAVDLESLRPEFRTAVEGLNPGEVSAVTAVDDQFVLLRLETDRERAWIQERDAARAAAFDERHSDAAGLLRSAIDDARAFVPPDSRLARSLYELAEILRIQGDVPEAIGFYNEALAVWEAALGPAHADTLPALNRLADVYLARGDHPRAADVFRRSLAIRERALGPDDSTVAATLNSLGLVAHLEADYSEARIHFERALGIWENTLGPDHVNVASALSNLAVVDMIEERYGEAEHRISRSLAILDRALGPNHPESAETLRALAELRGVDGDWDSARELYQRSLAIRWGNGGDDPAVTDVFERFVDLLALDRFSGTVETGLPPRFEELLADAPLREELYIAMGGMLEAEGRPEAALAVLARAVERFPASRMAVYRFAQARAARGRLPEAIAAIERALALEGAPPNERILVRQGDILLDLDRLEEARAAFAEAVRIRPGDPDARVGLAEVEFRSGRVEDAIGQFIEALRIEPDHAHVHYRLSEAYLRSDQPAEAVRAASRAVELDPGERRAHYVLGRALIALGRSDEGQDAMETYTRLEERAREENRRVLEVSAIEAEAASRVVGGDIDTAIGLLEAGVRDHPDAYWLALGLGSLQSLSGREEASARTFESMIDGGIGDDAIVRRNLGRVWRGLGDVRAAERHEALALDRLYTGLASALSQ